MPKLKAVHFRIIGDVHGKLDEYAHLASEAEYSLQVGDMGFDYRYITRIVDSDRHKAIGGNHDNYTKYACVCNPLDTFLQGPGNEDCTLCQGKGYTYKDQSKHFLGDYGIHEVPGFGKIFFVRGAWSIDWKHRTPGMSWWEDEEIPYGTMQKALAAYEKEKPDFMVTHTIPTMIIPDVPFERIFGPTIHSSRTEELLQQMYDIHQPKMWLFGHWHVNWEQTLPHVKTRNETTFICLDELCCKDFPETALQQEVKE